MYNIQRTSNFKKSFKKLSSNKNFKIENFEYVLSKLVNDETLETKYRDHNLVGDWLGFRECHLQNDMLLIYKKDKGLLILVLADIGTHSQLF
jgi:mRNA interferase YafQ